MSHWREREAEARQIAQGVVSALQHRSYPDLAASFLGKPDTWTEAGPSGVTFGVEVEGIWDSGKPGDLRLLVSVHEESAKPGERRWAWQRMFWSTFCPIRTDFIVTSDQKPDDTTP